MAKTDYYCDFCYDTGVFRDEMGRTRTCRDCGGKSNFRFNPANHSGKCRTCGVCGVSIEVKADGRLANHSSYCHDGPCSGSGSSS